MNRPGYDLSILGISPVPGVGKIALANENAMNASFLSEPLSD